MGQGMNSTPHTGLQHNLYVMPNMVPGTEGLLTRLCSLNSPCLAMHGHSLHLFSLFVSSQSQIWILTAISKCLLIPRCCKSKHPWEKAKFRGFRRRVESRNPVIVTDLVTGPMPVAMHVIIQTLKNSLRWVQQSPPYNPIHKYEITGSVSRASRVLVKFSIWISVSNDPVSFLFNYIAFYFLFLFVFVNSMGLVHCQPHRRCFLNAHRMDAEWMEGWKDG